MANPQRMIFVINDDDPAVCAGHEALVRTIIDSHFAGKIKPVFEHYNNGGSVFLRVMDRKAPMPDLLLIDSGTYAGMDGADQVHALSQQNRLPAFAIISDAPYLAIAKFGWFDNPIWCGKVFSKSDGPEKLYDYVAAAILERLQPRQSHPAARASLACAS